MCVYVTCVIITVLYYAFVYYTNIYGGLYKIFYTRITLYATIQRYTVLILQYTLHDRQVLHNERQPPQRLGSVPQDH